MDGSCVEEIENCNGGYSVVGNEKTGSSTSIEEKREPEGGEIDGQSRGKNEGYHYKSTKIDFLALVGQTGGEETRGKEGENGEDAAEIDKSSKRNKSHRRGGQGVYQWSGEAQRLEGETDKGENEKENFRGGGFTKKEIGGEYCHRNKGDLQEMAEDDKTLTVGNPVIGE